MILNFFQLWRTQCPSVQLSTSYHSTLMHTLQQCRPVLPNNTPSLGGIVIDFFHSYSRSLNKFGHKMRGNVWLIGSLKSQVWCDDPIDTIWCRLSRSMGWIDKRWLLLMNCLAVSMNIFRASYRSQFICKLTHNRRRTTLLWGIPTRYLFGSPLMRQTYIKIRPRRMLFWAAIIEGNKKALWFCYGDSSWLLFRAGILVDKHCTLVNRRLNR